jgi:CRP-like cAMP-binding protein
MLDTAWPPTTFLGGLTDPERDRLLNAGADERFEPGACLMSLDDAGEFVLLLRHGEAKVVADGATGQRLLGFEGPGDVVGSLPYLVGRRLPSSVIALRHRPVAAVRLDREGFTTFFDAHPRAGLVLARTIAERLHALERGRLVPVGLSVEQRVLGVLVELARLTAPVGSSDAEIPLTQLEIAQLLDVAQVSVQRALRALAAQGLALPGYRKIHVSCLRCAENAAVDRDAGPCRH